MTNADKIIVALDVATKKEALAVVEQLREQISFFKIGLQLYTAEGPGIVRDVLATGAKVFLDLKLHDIPNTVERAVGSAGQLGVHMLTIHLCGGEEMTSADQQTLRQVGISDEIHDHVLRLAKLGVEARIDGLVASAHEVKMLRAEFGTKTKLVVPGIRPSWSEAGDQERVMTPREALGSGADFLVIGRPIIAHSSPREAVGKILDEIGR